ncbi:hypothetical protein C8E97_2894 [Saccharothrix australiensis]|uniref:Uncharacterized protein n=1 Tax=Saccharothrix australiensis TaxID=2072 RepID=A0A495W384_9PSEU|nr:hypothetical protein C8E97_2894 [Saccharothrix australiensis]
MLVLLSTVGVAVVAWARRRVRRFGRAGRAQGKTVA